MKFLITPIAFLSLNLACSQSFTSFFVGNSNDMVTSPQGGVCLMGGSTEDDEAMKWFLNRANGGDVVVLRASGSDGYNNYFYSELGVTINSVETIRFNNVQASTDPYVLDKIKKAEAIWIAGGDQWNYVSYWRNSPIDSLINRGIVERNLVIGGTSAGMAVLGSHYFTAQNGTITSALAMQNPFSNNLTIDNAPFFKVPFMNGVITDTHYDNPDRRGRHTAFIARFLFDYGQQVRGIACDEYTAVCIDQQGEARVFGTYPDYDDNAYFIQINCELDNINPENLAPNQPITWNRGGEALKVYAVKGTSNGANSFNLNTWSSGVGGTWQHWSIDQGTFSQVNGSSVECFFLSTENASLDELQIYPNPFADYFEVSVLKSGYVNLTLIALDGRQVLNIDDTYTEDRFAINTTSILSGMYIAVLTDSDGNQQTHRLIKQ